MFAEIGMNHTAHMRACARVARGTLAFPGHVGRSHRLAEVKGQGAAIPGVLDFDRLDGSRCKMQDAATLAGILVSGFMVSGPEFRPLPTNGGWFMVSGLMVYSRVVELLGDATMACKTR